MRVGVIHDRPCAREGLEGLLAGAGHQVLWTAAGRTEAARRCAVARPDLVVLGWAEGSGASPDEVAALVQAVGCPVVVVTSSLDRDAARVFQAMGAGALDAVRLPDACRAGGEAGAELLRRLHTLESLVAGRRRRAAPGPAGAAQALLLLGASTGGPRALATVLRGLGPGWTVPVVVVQHVDVQFAGELAAWLGKQCGMPVRLAEEGESPAPGAVLLAGRDGHLRLDAGGRLRYGPEPREEVYRPSVNVLFESVAAHWRGGGAAVLLTGMGRDGARGLLALRRRGFHTIAEHASTCAVYGMPRAAVELGAAKEVLPLPRIAAAVEQALQRPLAERRAGRGG
ncbi:MAG: chemotaxis response regulator protein-glutamate methylesterase [Gammaproteobacteria bacterium]|nr:MAG: chemotaxis response regulator protein-glutamate methylesterase [Gammaproteobacteria bacterium]